jgi:hypothetical protein
MNRCLLGVLAGTAVLFVACQTEETRGTGMETSKKAIPEPLDDEWTRWIVGEWEGAAESDLFGKAEDRMTVELGLGGQFLIIRYTSDVAEMSPEQRSNAKALLNLSDEDIEGILSTPFHGLDIHTVNPKTGRIVAYSFDSWRSIIRGTGRRQGDREVLEWADGMSTSTRITEKLTDDRLRITETWSLPDGRTMEETSEMRRVNRTR